MKKMKQFQRITSVLQQNKKDINLPIGYEKNQNQPKNYNGNAELLCI
jgi:hypothetical protein